MLKGVIFFLMIDTWVRTSVLSSISDIFQLKLIPKLFLIQHYRSSKAALFPLIYRKSANDEQKYDRQLWVVGLLLKASLTASILVRDSTGNITHKPLQQIHNGLAVNTNSGGIENLLQCQMLRMSKTWDLHCCIKKHAMHLSFSRVFPSKLHIITILKKFILDKGTNICHKTDIFYVQNMMKFGLNSNIL